MNQTYDVEQTCSGWLEQLGAELEFLIDDIRAQELYQNWVVNQPQLTTTVEST